MAMRGVQKPGHRVITTAVRWPPDAAATATAAGYSRHDLLALLAG